MIITSFDSDMNSSLILSEVVIKDNDLFIPKRHRNQSVCTESHSDSNDEIVVTIENVVPMETTEDTLSVDEYQLMRSLGLPTRFTSRDANKRSKRSQQKTRTVAKPKKFYEDIDAVSAKLSDLLSRECDESHVDISPMMSPIVSMNDTLEDFGSVQAFNRPKEVKDLSHFKREHLWLDMAVDATEEQHSDDKSGGDKQSINGDNCDDSTRRLTSVAKSLIINSFINDSDSDSDGPPEERPTIIKRQHENDSIDFAEEVSEKSEKQKETKVRKVVNNKKPKSKYWHQRYRLFSRFDDGIQMDTESWYSVTPERIAKHIAHRFSLDNQNFIIIDAFCGSGGNTIQFALISPFVKVVAIDIDMNKISCAKHNAKIYGVDKRIEFICADYLVLAKTGALFGDAVFLSPPWGGPKYLNLAVYTLDMMSPSGTDVYDVTRDHITDNIGILLPRNIDTNGVEELAGVGNRVEIEDNLMNNKIKTKTAYFGNLIQS